MRDRETYRDATRLKPGYIEAVMFIQYCTRINEIYPYAGGAAPNCKRLKAEWQGREPLGQVAAQQLQRVNQV